MTNFWKKLDRKFDGLNPYLDKAIEFLCNVAVIVFLTMVIVVFTFLTVGLIWSVVSGGGQ